MIDTYRDDFLQFCLHLMGVRLVICRLDLTLLISFTQFLFLRDENSDICVTGVVRLGLEVKSKFRTNRLFKVSFVVLDLSLGVLSDLVVIGLIIETIGSITVEA